MWWRLTYRVHSSWRIAIACAAFVAGVACSMWLTVAPSFGIICLFILIGLLFVGGAGVLPVTAGVAMLLGVSYGGLHLLGRERYEDYIGEQAVVTGRVKEDVSRNGSGGISIQLDSVEINGNRLPGTILVSARTNQEILRGDALHFSGSIGEPFGSFPASVLLLSIQKVERNNWNDIGRVIRDWFAAKVRLLIPEPQASLGIGFLTGQKSALPEDLADALKIAGLTHIVVASGYNLTILVRLARKLFLKVSKYVSAVSAGGMIALFVLITGLSPSMTRAGLVSSMSLLAWYYGRVFHPFILLPVAGAITVALQPSYVWGDMGWQLSFSAFVGVMIVAPLLQTYFFGAAEPGIFRQVLGETIAAHIVTVPIIAVSFGTVSNVAVIANILVVPLVPLAMLLTFISGLIAISGVSILNFIAEPTSWLLGYMTKVAQFVAEIPWAQSELQIAPALWLVYVLVLFAFCFWMWRKTNYSFRNGEPTTC